MVKLPIEWLSLPALTERWSGKVHPDEINELIRGYVIIRHFRCPTDISWKARHNGNCDVSADLEPFFCVREIEIFEDKYFHGPTQFIPGFEINHESDEVNSPETDKCLCNRLRQEGSSDKEIAQALKRKFPVLTPHKIGKLITEEPGVTVTADAYRQRGNRLLR